MLGLVESVVLYILQITLTIFSLILSIFCPQYFFTINRSIFIIHQIFHLLYILIFSNPFTFNEEAQIINHIKNYEFLSTTSVNFIYVWLLNRSAMSNGIPFFSLIVFFLFCFIVFIANNGCEWSIKDSLTLSVCKFQSYQIIHLLLVICCTVGFSYFTWKQEKHPLNSFFYHVLLTIFSYFIFYSAPKMLIVGLQSSPQIEAQHIFIVNFCKLLMLLVPVYNLLFLFLINIQHPKERKEIYDFIDSLKLGRNIGKVHQIPHISIEEEKEEPNMVENHIAINLMKNPINSFYKLQRQYEGLIADSVEVCENEIGEKNENNPCFLSVPKESYDLNLNEDQLKITTGLCEKLFGSVEIHQKMVLMNIQLSSVSGEKIDDEAFNSHCLESENTHRSPNSRIQPSFEASMVKILDPSSLHQNNFLNFGGDSREEEKSRKKYMSTVDRIMRQIREKNQGNS